MVIKEFPFVKEIIIKMLSKCENLRVNSVLKKCLKAY